MRSLLARVDRVLGSLPGENYSQEEMIAEVWPLIVARKREMAEDDHDTMMLAMQTFANRALAKWAGRVADSVLAKVKCFAITYTTFQFHPAVRAGLNSAEARVVVEDARRIVMDVRKPRAKGYEDSWWAPRFIFADRLENRDSRYWDDVLDFFGDPDHDIHTTEYSLPAFMRYTGMFTCDRRDQ
jgi:hypothetical protein